MKSNRTIVTRVYKAIDGKEFSDRQECLAYERKLTTVANVKNALATVFDNHEDIYASLVDGLVNMSVEDRKTVLNGLITLTIERKKPIRKVTVAEVVTETVASV
jgi:hypothetical protein